ncbi:hypothetical protein [Micromonospora aurantiaca (nom. illeg.)]
MLLRLGGREGGQLVGVVSGSAFDLLSGPGVWVGVSGSGVVGGTLTAESSAGAGRCNRVNDRAPAAPPSEAVLDGSDDVNPRAAPHGGARTARE